VPFPESSLNDEAGKLVHYFAPNMHGNCHVPNFNARPRSFYITGQSSKPKKSAPRKVRYDSRQEKELQAELKRMRAMLN